jgi:hypothetical protein
MQINSVYYPFLYDNSRYLVLFGGAGSGKSVFAAQKILVRMMTERGHRFLVIRKVKRTVRASVFQLFIDLISEMNIYNEFVITKNDMRIRFEHNGNEIIFAGIDDPEKIKSIAGISGVWIEEATELDEEDFDQIDLRIRGEMENYKQFLVTFNPVDVDHWIKKKFFDSGHEEVKTLKTTYKDNAFLDDQYIQVLRQRISANENLHKIYVLGEWGQATFGGEFYKGFKHSVNVGRCIYDPSKPLHVTFDFNVHPYMTCLVHQVDGKQLKQIDEICLPDPKNTTVAVCRKLARVYRSHVAPMYIYGDPAGRARDTRGRGNDFSIIQKELEQFRPEMRVAKSAPPIALRGAFINLVFEDELDGLSIRIDERCEHTIRDYMYVKEAKDGTKHKEKKRDPNSKVSYEKYGHCSDANDYLICQVFGSEFRKFKNGDVLAPIIKKRIGNGY